MHKQSIFSPLLTYARYDVEEVVDLLVHSCGDDFDLWECVGHRMDSHFCHEQRHQQDLILLDIMVLKIKTHPRK